MIKSASTLLKGCLKCGLQFDNYEQLANHQKTFCVDGDYGSIQKLENKYQEYTSPKTDRPHMNPKIGGSAERNTDFQRIYNQEAQNREAQWALDINRIKQEKAALRLKKDEDQEALADLMRESEQNKEKTMRTRVEKEQIKRELVDLDKNKLKYLEEEKRGQLEKLAAQREQLKQAEHQLNNDLMRYENEMKTMNKIREDDIKRQDDALEKFKRRGDENFKVQDYLMQERSDRVAELKMRRENLEFEKQRLMEEQERMKNGDFSGSKRPNYGLFAANQMLNTMNAIKNYDIGSARQAINSDQQRINDMKNEQRNIVRNEHIYPDYLHSSPPSNKVNPIPISLLNPSPNYGSPERPGNFMSNPKKGPTASPFANNANNILTPRLLTASQSMTNIHQPLLLPGGLPDGAQPQSLSEVLQAKAKYINSGGQDPVALRNFENLEHYYKGVETRRAANGLDSERSQANPQLQELIDKQDHENLKIKHEIEMLKIQKTKVPPANGQGGNFTIADMNLKLNGINPNGKKMFNIYGAGNEFFIQNEARCVDLDEYERMAVNIEAQEVDALRMLSQLPIGTELYRFKLEQFKELSQSRAEMEKIIQEQRLLEMRRGFEVVRRKEDINYETIKWVDEQRKNIIANRLRKNLNPTKVAKGYDPSEGLVIHWDYLLSVPKRNDRCQIVYGIYINGNEVYPPSMLEPHPTEIDTSVTNRCIFGKSHPVADIPANANALLIFEVQLFPSKDSTNPRLTSFGWSQLDLFDARRELKRGKFKVPLYECPTDTNQDIDGIRDLVPVQNGVSWLYLRISYPFDDDIGKVSSIYPENTHMEYNIPQIHLRNFRPAAEGQFTSMQYGYPQEMQPYTRNLTPQTYPPQQSVYPPPHQPQQSPPVEQPTLTQTQFMPPPDENTTLDNRKSTFHGDQTGIPGNTLNQTASVESQDVSTISRAPKKKPGKGKKGGKGKDSDRSIRKPKNGNTSSINQTKMSGKEIELIYDPFIPNDKPQYIDRTFEKGMGVDFYIDGCRFLPDNVTVVKIAVQIVTVDFDIIKNAESNLPDLSVSTTYNPLFNFRVEIRPQTFNPTALAFISIDTIDKASNETKIVGYAGINLFINRFTAKQPESQNDTDIVLLSGNYQLPIYCQEPFRTKPFNMEKVESLERLPTASILVRIRQAPLSDDGLRVLNLRDVPPKEWAARQIWVPRPAYAAKAYNTSYYKVRDSEKELFNIRQGKEDPPLRETAQLLLNAENINKEMEDEEMVLYLDDKINRNSSTGLIDLLYFARYRPEAGFKFALDGLHNISTAQPYIGLYSLNPPGNFYVYDDGDEPDVSKLQLNSVLDWDGPLMSPKFLDGYMTFKDIPFHKNLNLVVDIRTVNLMKHPPQFSQIGWTIVPIFTPDGFVLSGIYQVPLIAGAVNPAIVRELEGSDPWPYILDQIKAKKIKWLGQTSIMIRLVDAQREGHYEQSWDFTRVDYRYLPKKDLQKYAYNNNADAKAKTGKILKSIVPNKGNPQAYQKRITEAFVKELGLKYNHEN